MLELPSSLVLSLNAAWKGAQRGRPAVLCLGMGQKRSMEPLREFLKAIEGLGAEEFFEFDASSAPLLPYAPLSQAIAPHYRREKDINRLFNRLKVFPRHRPYWKAVFHREGLREDAAPEPLIWEEFPMEQLRLDYDIATLVNYACLKKPMVVLCANAQALPLELIKIIEGKEDLGALLLVLCFQAMPPASPPGSPSWESFMNRKIEAGDFISLDQIDHADRAKCSSLDPEQARALMCFFHIDSLRMAIPPLLSSPHVSSLTPEMEYRLREVLAQAYELSGELSLALAETEALSRLRAQGDISGSRTALECLCARIHQGLGNYARSTRLVIEAWEGLGQNCGPQEIAQTEFILFQMNGNAGLYRETYRDLETRLLPKLEELGWENHIAFVLNRNQAFFEFYHREGYEEALKRLKRVIKICEDGGNIRRLAQSQHLLGSLEEEQGQWIRAEKAFLQSRQLLSPIAKGTEIARNDNGLGYFYFLTGMYDKAYRYHVHALELLCDCPNYEETLRTVFNIGRVFLLHGQAAQCQEYLETAIRSMEERHCPDILFHPRQNFYSLLSVAQAKLGQEAAARKNLVRAQEVVGPEPNPHVQDYHLWTEALLGESSNLYTKAEERIETRLATARPLLIHILIDSGDFELRKGEEGRARSLWKKGLGYCLGQGFHGEEKNALIARLAAQSLPQPRPFPAARVDPKTILGIQSFTVKG